MTPERLAEIAARFETARPKEDRGGEELKMAVSPQRGFQNSTPTKIFYADGDGCATISSNIGLDVDADALAIFWAHAWLDVRDLLEEIERCDKLKKLHDDLTKLLVAAEGDDLVDIVKQIIQQRDAAQEILTMKEARRIGKIE